MGIDCCTVDVAANAAAAAVVVAVSFASAVGTKHRGDSFLLFTARLWL